MSPCNRWSGRAQALILICTYALVPEVVLWQTETRPEQGVGLGMTVGVGVSRGTHGPVLNVNCMPSETVPTVLHSYCVKLDESSCTPTMAPAPPPDGIVGWLMQKQSDFYLM